MKLIQAQLIWRESRFGGWVLCLQSHVSRSQRSMYSREREPNFQNCSRIEYFCWVRRKSTFFLDWIKGNFGSGITLILCEMWPEYSIGFASSRLRCTLFNTLTWCGYDYFYKIQCKFIILLKIEINWKKIASNQSFHLKSLYIYIFKFQLLNLLCQVPETTLLMAVVFYVFIGLYILFDQFAQNCSNDQKLVTFHDNIRIMFNT